MILIGLGANLPFEGAAPKTTLSRALRRMEGRGIAVRAVSSIYASPPKPLSGQPWFANLVARIETRLGPEALLAELHALEARMSRTRRVRWAARTLDTDIIDYHGAVVDRPDLALPHPRMAERLFVLEPLAEIAPLWRHPVTGEGVAALLRRARPGETLIRVATAPISRDMPHKKAGALRF